MIENNIKLTINMILQKLVTKVPLRLSRPAAGFKVQPNYQYQVAYQTRYFSNEPKKDDDESKGSQGFDKFMKKLRNKKPAEDKSDLKPKQENKEPS